MYHNNMNKQVKRKHSSTRINQQDINYGVLNELIGYTVRRAQIAITDAFDRELSALGITTQRFSALVLIQNNPGLGQTALADAMGIARTGALAIVNALIDKGLIEQKSSSSDRRACELSLSRSGASRIKAIVNQVREHDRLISSRLNASEKEQLTLLLEKLATPE